MPAAKKPKKIVYSLRLDPADATRLEQIRERDGVPASEQIRRALRTWFEQKGVLKPKRPS
ncbi:MAG: ribbon-helix-helix domain-containing protein [Vicinamibacterales bacterium]|nr:ribbon-helix-helix domain-containing protein [Vicinamibacterales bacterium]